MLDRHLVVICKREPPRVGLPTCLMITQPLEMMTAWDAEYSFPVSRVSELSGSCDLSSLAVRKAAAQHQQVSLGNGPGKKE